MNLSVYPHLEQWLSTFNHFPKNDALVDLDNTLHQPFSQDLDWKDKNVQKIILQASESIRSYGVNPLTLVHGVVTKIGEENVQIPFELEDLTFEIHKIKQKVSITIKEESKQINPYLIFKLKQQFDLTIELKDWENLTLLADKFGIHIDKENDLVIGNYHPNRYLLRNELEELIQQDDFSLPLKEQIELCTFPRNSLNFSEDELVYFDDDQNEVCQEFDHKNLVVEGPPGTGKSQLLIGILGKTLLNNQKALVASAKQTALDVIEKRMNQLGLGGFIFTINDSTGLRTVYEKLGNQWKAIESAKPAKATINIRPTLHNQLQFKLDIWNQPNLIGESNWSTYKAFDNRFNKELGKWMGTAPTFQYLLEHELLIEKIYTLQIASIIHAWNDFIKDCAPAELLTKFKKVEEWIALLPSFYTKFDLEALIYKQITHQLFETQFAKAHFDLLNPDGKDRKRLLKNIQRLEKMQQKLHPLQANRSHWKVNLSAVELENHLQETQAVGWWNKHLFKKKWKKWSSAPAELANDLIQEELDYKHYQTQLAEIQLDLPLEEAKQIAVQLSPFTEEQWKRYQSISENEKIILHSWSTEWNQIVRSLKAIKWNTEFPLVEQLKQWKTKLESCIADYQFIQRLPHVIIQALADADSFETYMCNAIKTHWLNFKAHYPQLADFEEAKMDHLFNEFNQTIESEQNWCSQKIIDQTKIQFEYYHELLARPSAQLKEEDKLLKKKLKKGKAILLKEFNKKQQHLKLRSLLNTEAKIWIDLLQPIQLSNPIQLAMHAPLKKGMYDLAIIDEASQLLTAHSTGILHRAKAILIAGDQQQMQPHFFFQSNQHSESLMQHAKFILPSTQLTHHYRSANPALIEFSNQYFYQGKLSVFPHFKSKNAIHLYKVDGYFINRQNQKEAEQVALLLAQLIQGEETIGIVAFSQNQIDLIRKSIPKSLLAVVQERESTGQLFILPLDKVQGDECDHLIISCTYARDEAGQLTQRFGLLSMDGGRNRLNVLATRASQSIHVVSSIISEEILPSTNPNTELFRRWILYLETFEKLKELPNYDNTICIPLHEGLTLREILTRKRIYEARGWKITYA